MPPDLQLDSVRQLQENDLKNDLKNDSPTIAKGSID